MDRIIEISQDNRHLAVERGFMVILEQGTEIGRVPLDQIGCLIINAHGITYSNNLIIRLAEYNALIVACGQNHLPTSIILPIEGHYMQSKILLAQAQMKQSKKDILWKEIVKAKIIQQASIIETISEQAEQLLTLAKQVKNGDPENIEGHAAYLYFKILFGLGFRRQRNDTDLSKIGIENSLLNYGYTIIRSAMIRSIIASGLHPSIGLHHCNQFNSMQLADDLMEPFRPIIDYTVFQMIKSGIQEIDTSAKKRLVNVLSVPMKLQQKQVEISYLMNVLTSSLSTGILNENIKLKIPKALKGSELLAL
ncbi:MAG: type II CRISPR-associated endonuclease Cas1 [Alphaproteobacteria bacterium]|nr:type II CRISPR-associated endonuclease Cas1 [Alphaproteobacteria bacterium]